MCSANCDHMRPTCKIWHFPFKNRLSRGLLCLSPCLRHCLETLFFLNSFFIPEKALEILLHNPPHRRPADAQRSRQLGNVDARRGQPRVRCSSSLLNNLVRPYRPRPPAPSGRPEAPPLPPEPLDLVHGAPGHAELLHDLPRLFPLVQQAGNDLSQLLETFILLVSLASFLCICDLKQI